MYRKDDGQISMNEFISPFGKLHSENRWVKLAAIVPWEEIDEEYAELFRQKVTGAPAKNSRIAFGAMYIKEKYKCSDEETVAAIQENPYLQYFLGLNEYQYKPLFSPSTMVYFRKRLTPEAIRSINEMIMQREAVLQMSDEGKVKTGKETAEDLSRSAKLNTNIYTNTNMNTDMNRDMKPDMNANMNPDMNTEDLQYIQETLSLDTSSRSDNR